MAQRINALPFVPLRVVDLRIARLPDRDACLRFPVQTKKARAGPVCVGDLAGDHRQRSPSFARPPTTPSPVGIMNAGPGGWRAGPVPFLDLTTVPLPCAQKSSTKSSFGAKLRRWHDTASRATARLNIPRPIWQGSAAGCTPTTMAGSPRSPAPARFARSPVLAILDPPLSDLYGWTNPMGEDQRLRLDYNAVHSYGGSATRPLARATVSSPG